MRLEMFLMESSPTPPFTTIQLTIANSELAIVNWIVVNGGVGELSIRNISNRIGVSEAVAENKRTRPAKWMATVAPNEIAGSECASQIGDIEAVQNLNLLFIEGVMGRVLLQGLPAPDTPARLGY